MRPLAPIPESLKAALADRYRLDREIGSGGMARVYLAHDLKHDREVAIKVLKSEFGAMLGAQRFLGEIKVMANLQHPNLLPLFDSGEAEGRLFYVMPRIEGESLRERLDREGKLSVEETVRVVTLIAGALDYAHSRSVIHRDLKPENILLQAGQPVIADFGIALAVKNAGGRRITQSGFTLGTPEYMSPEQAAGDQAVDARSDQYALGALAYEMLTGDPPHTDTNPQVVIRRVVSESPRHLREHRSDIPQAVDSAVQRALEKIPGDRFSSCGDFARALGGQVGDGASPGPTRIHWPVIAAGALVLIVATAAGVWWSQGKARATALLPEIERLADRGDYQNAFALAAQARPRLSHDSAFAALFTTISNDLTVLSQPAGAQVYLAAFSDSTIPDSSDGTLIGTTPIRHLAIARDDYRVIVRAPGHAPARGIASRVLGPSGGLNPDERELLLEPTLPATGSVPEGMEPIPGGHTEILGHDVGRGASIDLAAFALDRFETSNARYAEFVQGGGYRDPTLWPAVMPPAQLGQFKDRTGLQAPRDWSRGAPAAGREQYPVTGVSWYEASAYCRWRGGRLPTLFEWEKASRNDRTSKLGILMPWGQYDPRAVGRPRANLLGNDVAPVNSYPFAISPYGVANMAGNVKEWLANRVGDGWGTTGASWQDPVYLYSQVGEATAGAPSLGFRCARTLDPAGGTNGDGPLSTGIKPVSYTPVGPAAYQALLAMYRYDRRPANARGRTTLGAADWIRERIWIDGAKSDSVLLYLFLPRSAAPPYQTVVLIPSSAAFTQYGVPHEVESQVATIIKAGRAVLAPVLSGMIERQGATPAPRPAPSSVEFRDQMVGHATEIRLAMDYASTRSDIDSTRFAYVALSFGAASRIAFAAVDPRFRSVILLGTGIDERLQPTLPEAANFNFAPHITAPKLVLNGRQDEEHPWLSRGKAMWDLLKEPKELILVDGAGHAVPVEARSGPMNAFLDRTLGPVRPR